MSESSSENLPAPVPPLEPEKRKQKKPKLPFGKRWRRRFKIFFLTVVILFLLFRIALQFMLPTVIRRTALAYGLNASYERHEMDLLGGDVGIWHLVLSPAEGGAPLLKADYCRGDVSTWDLIRGRLVVRRLEAEGLDVNVERDARGQIALLKKFASTQPSSPPRTVAAAQPTDINLTSPFRLDTLRIDRVHAHVRDLSVSPAVETNIEFNLRLTDLRSPIRPIGFDLELSARPLLDSLRAKGQGRASGKTLDATMQVVISGIHPSPAAGYLLPLGIKPVAHDLSMTAKWHVLTGAAPGIGALSAQIDMDSISLTADGDEVAAVDQLKVSARSVSDTFADVGKVLLSGGHVAAERSPSGALRIAGIELAPTPPSPKTPSVFHWNVDQVDVENVRAEFTDQAAQPPAQLRLMLQKLTAGHLSDDPRFAKGPMELAATMSAPGVAKEIKVEGKAQVLKEPLAAELALNVSGIKPDALKPYFDAAGVECLMKDAALNCSVTASMANNSVDAHLKDVKLSDGKSLFALKGVDVSGFRMGGADERIHADAIELNGPALHAEREASGEIRAVGFRTIKAKAQARAAGGSKAAATQAGLPKFDIGRLSWKGLAVRYADKNVSPPTLLKMDDAGVEITNFRLDANADGTPLPPATIKAWFKVPGLAGDLKVNGVVTHGGRISNIDVDVNGEGLSADPIRSYLHASGIEPVLRDAAFRAHLNAGLALNADGSVKSLGNVSLSNLALTDASGELASIGGLVAKGLDSQPNSFAADLITVDRPRLKVRREKDGTFSALGIHTLPVAAASAKKPATSQAGARFATVLQSLQVNDAALEWIDDAVAMPVDLKAAVTASVDHISLGGKDAPATINATAKLNGCVDRLTIAGKVVPSATSPDAHFDITGEGLRAGQLAVYLPPTIRSTLKDGRFKMALDAGVSPNAKGGFQGRFIVDKLELQDGRSGPPLLKVDNATVKVSRYDVPQKVVAIDEISTKGIDADVAMTPGGVTLFGIELIAAPMPVRPAPKPVADVAPESVGPTTRPSNEELARMVAATRLDLPLITVAKLSVGVHHFGLDGAMSAPIALDDFSLTGQNIEMLGKSPENRRPIDLALRSSVAPFAGSLTATIHTSPFALQPSAKIEFAAGGITGAKLLAAFPDLKSEIDGSGLTDGRIKAQVRAEVKMDRRDLLRLDFSRPFDVNFSLKDLDFRNGRDPLLAGVGELRSESLHVEPATGAMHAKQVEIDNLAATVTREKDGLHAFGLVLKSPTTPTTQPSPTSAPAATVAAAATRPAAEMRVDAFIVSGVDFRFEDRCVDPPAIVPINALEFEARDLSNMLLYDAGKSTRFSLLVNSGKVPLPRGMKKTATTTPATRPEVDERELFSQLTASGKMELCPEPKGWMKLSLGGFEVASMKGEARRAGFDLSGGTLDANIDARFLDSGTLDLRPRFVFVDLGIAEPQKGPIERMFKLPVSLDGAIALLQDASGQITVPLHVVIEHGKLQTGTVVGSAISAVTGIVATAAASAPLKVGQGVASLVGIKFNKKRPPPAPLTLAFDPASTAFSEGARLPAALIERLTREPALDIQFHHELGAADVKLVGERTNLSGADAQAVSYQLRQSKTALLKQRAKLAGDARGRIESGLDAEAVVDQLKETERELAVIEDGLDDLNELVRPGAGHQAMRRTRAACISLGEQRLIATRDYLLASGIPNIAERIHLQAHAKFNPADDENQPGRVVLTFAPNGK